MIRTIEDFVTVWNQEAANTLKLFRGLSDASMPQAITGEHRDLGRLAWHITTTIREMMERTGLHVEGPEPDAPVPSSAEEIVKEYARSSESFVKSLDAWTDATLDQEDNLYGESWRRSLTLQILLLHQTHHRGQMTVLMRQAGLPVPGMYGPAKEDWAKYGMPTPAI
ncbi:MAG: DinB family protein [Gemmatimonadota bacterium]